MSTSQACCQIVNVLDFAQSNSELQRSSLGSEEIFVFRKNRELAVFSGRLNLIEDQICEKLEIPA